MAEKTRHKESLPCGWKVLMSKTYPDTKYYFNEYTGETTWDCPQLLYPEAPKSSTCREFKDRSVSPSKLPSAINETRARSDVMVKYTNSDYNKDKHILLNLPDDIQVGAVASSKSTIADIKPSKIICPAGPLPNSIQLSNKICVLSASSSNSGAIEENNSNYEHVEASESEKNSVESQSGRKLVRTNLKRCPSLDSIESQVSKKLSDRGNSVNSIKVSKSISGINARQNQHKVRKTQSLSKHVTKQYPSKSGILNKTCPIKMQNQALKSSPVLASISPNFKISCSNNKERPQNKMINSQRRNSDGVSSERLNTKKRSLESCQFNVEIFDSFVIIMDTNILMNDLNMIDELKDTPLEGYGPPHLFIPWVVLNELNELKHARGKERQSKAIEAENYVHSMLTTEHPRFHVQTVEMAEHTEPGLDECKDDRILGCCLQFLEKMPKEKLILLTNDINLCNKALVHDVMVYTLDSFLKNVNADVELVHERNLSSDSKYYTQNENNEPEKELKMKVNSVICETKMLFKSILEPILEKQLLDAYGDLWRNIVLESPWSLLDILQMYEKYWDTVFVFALPQSLKCHFDELLCLFKISKGFFCNVDNASKALASIEVICGELLNSFHDIEPTVKRITGLSKKFKTLCKREENIEDENHRKKSVGSNNVYLVFCHIWDLMIHLCGMIMDFSGIPHNFTYQKPAEVPTKMTFGMLIANLYPNVNQIKKAMSGVLDFTIPSSDKDKYFTSLYKLLVQFVPSLQIQAMPPPLENFTILNLKSFCLDENNRKMLQNGFVQLLEFHSKLTECIHNWNK